LSKVVVKAPTISEKFEEQFCFEKILIFLIFFVIEDDNVSIEGDRDLDEAAVDVVVDVIVFINTFE